MAKLWRQWLTRSAISLTTTSLLIVLSLKAKLIVSTYQSPQLEAILVLGGGNTRELAAAQLAAQKPDLEVWVSSGLGPNKATKIFSAQNVGLTRINLDYSATDTVTNFTTLVAKLRSHNIRHIYLVTSDFHMPRSKAIAFWILGSRGIAYTPITVPSNQPPEPHHKIWRDVGRSLLWILTGRTGSSLDPNPPARSS
ncbi:MAG: YdcF family protein [Cyanobacteria bacterium J06656_5]